MSSKTKINTKIKFGNSTLQVLVQINVSVMNVFKSLI